MTTRRKADIYGQSVCIECATTVGGYLTELRGCPKCNGKMVLQKTGKK